MCCKRQPLHWLFRKCSVPHSGEGTEHISGNAVCASSRNSVCRFGWKPLDARREPEPLSSGRVGGSMQPRKRAQDGRDAGRRRSDPRTGASGRIRIHGIRTVLSTAALHDYRRGNCIAVTYLSQPAFGRHALPTACLHNKPISLERGAEGVLSP